MTVMQGPSNDTVTPIHSKGRYFFKGDQRVSARPCQYGLAALANSATSSSSKASSTACTARDPLTPSLTTVWTTSSEILLFSKNWD